MIALAATAAFLLLSCDPEIETPIDRFSEALVIPVSCNAWAIGDPEASDYRVMADGIAGWTDPSESFRVYFSLDRGGALELGLRARNADGPSELDCSFCGETRRITLCGSGFTTLDLGSFTVDAPGYNSFLIEPVSKSGSGFGEIAEVRLLGEAAGRSPAFRAT